MSEAQSSNSRKTNATASPSGDSGAESTAVDSTVEQVAVAHATRAADAIEVTLPKRILVVDDEAVSRKVVAAAFRNHVDEVVVAENGCEALDMFAKEPVDFVVTDLRMPEMTGIDVVEALRRSSTGAVVPVLILSSEGDEVSLFQALRCGADDFLTKPVSQTELRIRVSSIHLRQSLARDVNPLTRLPGNLMIKAELDRRLSKKGDLAVAYVDLDHFKAFNDRFGFDRGDGVIVAVADMLRAFSHQFGFGDVFIGHVGGDDYIALLPETAIPALEACVEHIGERLAAEFAPDERERGWYVATDRQGVERGFSLLSCSVGVVLPHRRKLIDARQVAEVAAEVKSLAKRHEGNHVFIDRRTASTATPL